MFTTFRGGNSGGWQILSLAGVKGEALPQAACLSVIHSDAIALPLIPSQTSWRLAGVASHPRYVERREKTALGAVQAGLGRSRRPCIPPSTASAMPVVAPASGLAR